MKKKNVQPKQRPITASDFAKRYMALCEETGFQIVVNPAFKARDDGTWSVVLQTAVGKFSKQRRS